MKPSFSLDLWQARETARLEERAQSMSEVVSALGEAVSILADAGCSEVWLVGSFAIGTPDPSSDVDLVVRGLPSNLRAEAVDALERLLRRPVDLVEYERIDPQRLAFILAGGRRIYP